MDIPVSSIQDIPKRYRRIVKFHKMS